jgi:hypothetical protein
MFVGKIPEASVATWIIVLAIITGVLILLLIIMALQKVRILMQRNISFQHRHNPCVSLQLPFNFLFLCIYLAFLLFITYRIICTNKCTFYYLSIISVIFLYIRLAAILYSTLSTQLFVSYLV